jgi:hypothetical protein
MYVLADGLGEGGSYHHQPMRLARRMGTYHEPTLRQRRACHPAASHLHGLVFASGNDVPGVGAKYLSCLCSILWTLSADRKQGVKLSIARRAKAGAI